MSRPAGSSSGNQGANSSEAGSGDAGQIVDLDFLRGLISAVDESGIDSLEIARGGTRIKVAKTAPGSGSPGPAPAPVFHSTATAAHTSPSAAAPPPVAPPASNLIDVKSPMVGTFYRASNPDSPSFVEVGSRVGKGQTLCILEAMKLMNELEAEVQGVIKEICVENADPVEYGQVLFRIEPDA